MPAANKIPEARVARGGDPARVFRAVLVAIAVTLVAWSIGPVMAGIVVGLGIVVVGTTWGLRRWIGEVEEPSPPPPVPAGDLVYPLRPGWSLLGVVLCCGVAGVVALSTPSFRAVVAGVLLLAIAVLFLARCTFAVVLGLRVRVTDTELEVPRSVWSGGTITAALKSLSVQLSRDGSILWVFVECEDYRLARVWLGDRVIRELHAVLVSRIAAANQIGAPHSR